VRRTLVAALASCADKSVKPALRRFLAGLSSDELQFIAGFLGWCILECEGWPRQSEELLAARITQYQCAGMSRSRCEREDRDNKIILLLEYLCHGGTERIAAGRT
jgi:hypothetical protein